MNVGCHDACRFVCNMCQQRIKDEKELKIHFKKAHWGLEPRYRMIGEPVYRWSKTRGENDLPRIKK